MSLYEFWNAAMIRACDERYDSDQDIAKAAIAWRHWRFRHTTQDQDHGQQAKEDRGNSASD